MRFSRIYRARWKYLKKNETFGTFWFVVLSRELGARIVRRPKYMLFPIAVVKLRPILLARHDILLSSV